MPWLHSPELTRECESANHARNFFHVVYGTYGFVCKERGSFPPTHILYVNALGMSVLEPFRNTLENRGAFFDLLQINSLHVKFDAKGKHWYIELHSLDSQVYRQPEKYCSFSTAQAWHWMKCQELELIC